MLKKILLLSALTLGCSTPTNLSAATTTQNNAVWARNAPMMMGLVQKLVSQSTTLLDYEKDFLIKAAQKQLTAFDPYETITLLNQVAEKVTAATPEDFVAISSLQTFGNNLISSFKEYKVLGMSFAMGGKASFILGSQSFDFNVTFRNDKREEKTRKFNLAYNTIGLQAGVDWRLHFIQIVGDDSVTIQTNNGPQTAFLNSKAFDLFSSAQTQELSRGIEFVFPVLLPLAIMATYDSAAMSNTKKALLYGATSCLTIANTFMQFKNLPGGIQITSLGFGPALSLSMVRDGGILRPLN